MIERRRRPRFAVPPQARGLAECHATDVAGEESVPWAALAMTFGIDLLCVVVIWTGKGLPLPTLTAGALHGVAAGALLMSDRLEGIRRTLALCLVLALPPVGAVLAVLALGTKRRSHLGDLAPEENRDPPVLALEHVQRVATALPVCEALLASAGEDRQALLASLTRRADADAVTLLRWLTSVSQDLAVETALALEELSIGFESALDDHRMAVTDQPSHATALQAGIFIGRAIASGIVDPAMIGVLAAEARRYLALAQELGAQSSHAVTMARARLEMAAMRPDAALVVLDQALSDMDLEEQDAPEDLITLRREARFASHVVLSDDLTPVGAQVLLSRGGRNEVTLDRI